MKKFLILFSLLGLILIAKAQKPLFIEGDKRINVGAGISTYPLLSLSGDYAIADGIADKGTLGLGTYAGSGFDADYVYMSVGARVTFHYPLIDNFDTYAGFSIGFRYGIINNASNKFNLIPGLFVGANYPIGKNLYVFGEIGTGLSYLTGGISFLLDKL